MKSSEDLPSAAGPLRKDVSAYLVAKALPGAIGLVAVTVLVRIAGVEEYGRYALLLAIATLGGVLSSTWLCQSILRMTPDGGLSAADLARVRWTYGIGSFGFAAVALTLGVARSGTTDIWSAIWSGSFLIAFHLYAVELALLQAHLKSVRFAVVEVARACLMLGLPLLLSLLVRPPSHGLLVGSALAYVGAWALLVRRRIDPDKQSSGPVPEFDLGRLLRFGMPLSAWAGASQALSVIDRYAVSHVLGDAAVGGYAAVYDVVVRGFGMALFPITMAVHPRIMRYALAGQHWQARAVLLRAGRAHALLGALLIPAGYALKGILTERILGLPAGEFDELVLPLLVGAFLWQSALLVHKPLEIANATRYMLVGMLLALCVAVGGNLLLVESVGLIGAALSMILSALAYILFIVFVKHRMALALPRPGPTETRHE
ncbi:MAG TPA: lipopolysaccharide biosynthesis protein [Steroidobacteraceae bacterium]|nr:lipopolysaccharide biosynthesis protein [Steroidobacteraceae bacterium]